MAFRYESHQGSLLTDYRLGRFRRHATSGFNDFESKEAAIKYAESIGLPYKVEEARERKHIIRKGGYGKTFRLKENCLDTLIFFARTFLM